MYWMNCLDALGVLDVSDELNAFDVLGERSWIHWRHVFWRKAPTESEPFRGAQQIDSDVKHRKAFFFFWTEAPTESKPPMMELAELDDAENEADEI